MKTNPKDVLLQECAPKGATHYRVNKGDCEWFKIDGSVYEQDPEWEWEILTSNPEDVKGWLDCVTEIPKPSHQETPDNSWDGEGMPPVGTVCEFTAENLTNHDTPWQSCRVVFVSNQCAVLEDPRPDKNGQVAFNIIETGLKFRPLRTERQKFTTKVREIFGKVESQVISDLANALYDANARFPENSK